MEPQRAFERIAAQGGNFVATWNWAAFFFGGIWYLVKGLWVKGLVILAICLFSGGITIPLLWLYSGIFGNWDYYLLKERGTQLWAAGSLASVPGAATGRTRRCPHCAEFIQPAAKVCRFCGRDVPNDAAPPPGA